MSVLFDLFGRLKVADSHTFDLNSGVEVDPALARFQLRTAVTVSSEDAIEFDLASDVTTRRYAGSGRRLFIRRGRA